MSPSAGGPARPGPPSRLQPVCPWRPLSPWGPGGRARCGPAAPRGRRRLPVPVPGLSPVAADSGEARQTPSCRLRSALTEGVLKDSGAHGSDRTTHTPCPRLGSRAGFMHSSAAPFPGGRPGPDPRARVGPECTPLAAHRRLARVSGLGSRGPIRARRAVLRQRPSPPFPPAPCAVPLAESRAARRGRKAGPAVVRRARRRGTSPAVPSAGVIGLRGAAARARRAACCPAQPWRERWCGRRRTMSAARTSGTTS